MLSVCPVRAIIPYLAIRGYIQDPYSCCKMAECSLTRFLAQPSNPPHRNAHGQGKLYTHSVCIGAATSAIDVGISDAQVKMLGCWRSDAYQRYMKTPLSELAQLSKKLAAGGKNSDTEPLH